jgi:lactoylglutathione lyase
MVEISSLVLFAGDLASTAAFYRAIGVPLADEDHGEGPIHAAAELAGVHFAIYQAEAGHASRAPQWRWASSDFPGFYVDSLDAATQALTSLGATLLASHESRPWGCRIVAQDPDGRAIEINQRDHCA